MKTIIIEGCDRVGKDTICNEIKLNADCLLYRHWQKPKGQNIHEKIEYQKTTFKKEFDLRKTFIDDWYLNDQDKDDNQNLILWNRSHIGEYVYGQLYRNSNPEWIYNLESIYNFSEDQNIYLVMLYADPNFLCEKDDGQSFSSDLESKTKEIDLFHEAVNKSLIQNKFKIKVNNGNRYKDKESIRREIFDRIFN